jgi:hypothetical protein
MNAIVLVALHIPGLRLGFHAMTILETIPEYSANSIPLGPRGTNDSRRPLTKVMKQTDN